METLPFELVERICSFLPAAAVLKLCQTSTQFRSHRLEYIAVALDCQINHAVVAASAAGRMRKDVCASTTREHYLALAAAAYYDRTELMHHSLEVLRGRLKDQRSFYDNMPINPAKNVYAVAANRRNARALRLAVDNISDLGGVRQTYSFIDNSLLMVILQYNVAEWLLEEGFKIDKRSLVEFCFSEAQYRVAWKLLCEDMAKYADWRLCPETHWSAVFMMRGLPLSDLGPSIPGCRIFFGFGRRRLLCTNDGCCDALVSAMVGHEDKETVFRVCLGTRARFPADFLGGLTHKEWAHYFRVAACYSCRALCNALADWTACENTRPNVDIADIVVAAFDCLQGPPFRGEWVEREEIIDHVARAGLTPASVARAIEAKVALRAASQAARARHADGEMGIRKVGMSKRSAERLMHAISCRLYFYK
jgi:hypothetical protein